MRFSPDFLDQIRSRLSIVELVGRKVVLKKKGKHHEGLCPFHNERTPSFKVEEGRGDYHCFGCGAHGDHFSFLIETEGLSFPEAVERLAEEAGLPMPAPDPEAAAKAGRRKGLMDATEAATQWYQKQLAGPSGRAAREYIRRRGLDEKTVDRFRLGYAPGTSGALRGALHKDGFDDETLFAAGLLKQPEETGRVPYDYLRDRIVFPIADRRGRVIAFGGRSLGDTRPKYLNSPDSDLFHKRKVLYGLDLARERALKGSRLAVVEGYIDVIAFDRSGICPAVAPLGTALTEEQLTELWRLTGEPIFCFDGDAAGKRAAEKAAAIALPMIEPGRSVRIAYLPTGEDPDDLLKSRGAPALEQVLDAAMPLVEAVWRLELDASPHETPEQIADLEKRLKARVSSIAEGTVQRLYRQAFDERFSEAFGTRGGFSPEQRPSNDNRNFKRRYPRFKGHPSQRPEFELAQLRPESVHEANRWRTNELALKATLNDPQMINKTTGREAVLLSMLVINPALIDPTVEDLGLIAFQNSEWESLRQGLIESAHGVFGLDSAALKNHLIRRGFGIAVDKLSRDPHAVAMHGAYVRRAEEELLDRWRRLHGSYRLERLVEDLAVAERTLAEETTEASWQRFQALKAEMERLRSDGILVLDDEEL